MRNKTYADKELEDKLDKFALFFFIFLGIPMLILFIYFYKEESKEIRSINEADYDTHIFKVVKIDEKPLARYLYLETDTKDIYLAYFKKTSKVDLFENRVGEELVVKFNKYNEKYYLVYNKVKLGDVIESEKELTYLKDGLPK